MLLTSDSRKQPRILVVDDDQMIRSMTREALVDEGYEVDMAETGELALAAFSARHYDAVLLDVLMPGMDGFETCRRLRQLENGAHTPILIVTGCEDLDSIRTAFTAGATDFITKPIPWTILGHRMRYMLRASQTFNELNISRKKLTTAQQIARLGHWELNLQDRRLHCSEASCTLLGLSPAVEPYDPAVLHQCAHPEDQERVRTMVEKALAEEEGYHLMHRVTLAGGEERIVRSQAEIVWDKARRRRSLMGTVQDVTELQQAQERIRYLNFYDDLTGLPNRSLFSDRLDTALTAAQRHNRMGAVLFIDLNRFKRINDTLGQGLGDQLLKEVAERLMRSIRQGDDISRFGREDAGGCVSRLRGDEFMLLLSEIDDPSSAAMVAQRLLDVVAQPFLIRGHELFLTGSIGICVFPGDGCDVETLIRHADTAMGHSKARGQGGYSFYEESMNVRSFERLSLEGRLRRAIEGEELLLHYQPQLSSCGKKIVGCEALVRWQPTGGDMVHPGDFIPLAEETGLIAPLGDWVLREACRQAMAWQQQGLPPLRIGVNLSAFQFNQGDVVEVLRSVLDDTGFDPQLLELEITESLLMSNFEETVVKLNELKQMGVGIAMDDFGTGYSSLSYLRQLPIDRLKIDRSFVGDIGGEGNDAAAIVEAIVAMAHALQLNVVAEGVETVEQLAFLQQMGCEELQGFHFSRPVPAERFADLVRS